MRGIVGPDSRADPARPLVVVIDGARAGAVPRRWA
jgi:hypothetical protein